MARKLRVQIPGGIYHLMSRGDRREEIFRDDSDRQRFLATLGDACAKTSWRVHAYCLLSNHFHLVVETPQPNLVAGMKWFLGTYTARFNRRHSLSGHLFAGRYKSQLVDPSGDCLQAICDYVHLNPARADLLKPEVALESYPWSSLRGYVDETQRLAWLNTDRLLDMPETKASREQFLQRLQRLRESDRTAHDRVIRSGWCIGSTEFRRQILEHMQSAIGSHHFGPEIRQAAEVKAGRIIDEELRQAVWTEAELLRKLKGDPIKLRIAERLRLETTVSLGWIATRLHMGTQGYLSHLLYWKRRADREHVTLNEAKAYGSRPRTTGPERNSAVGIGIGSRKLADHREVSLDRPTEIHSEALPVAIENTLPKTDPFEFDPTFD